MSKFTELEVGEIALIQQQENGRILQIGLTVEQSKLLQIFLAALSKESKLIQMSDDYDLVLKSSLCKKCRGVS
jgi:hypothetical protein